MGSESNNGNAGGEFDKKIPPPALSYVKGDDAIEIGAGGGSGKDIYYNIIQLNIVNCNTFLSGLYGGTSSTKSKVVQIAIGGAGGKFFL